jgi:cytochrome c peroxidase
MALPNEAAVLERVAAADYASLFQRVYGDVLADGAVAFQKVTRAIAAFERSERFAQFSSKFDDVLRGEASLSEQEERGFALFKDPEKGNCIACHAGDETSDRPQDWLFTDFTYDNLGIPRNPKVPDNAELTFFDLGVCAQDHLRERLPALASPEEYVASLCGAFKVPTLRNIALTAPYMHNGYFQELRDVVDFYVTRDTDPSRWYPTSEDGSVDQFNDLPDGYRGNVNHEEAPYDRKPGEEPRLSSNEIDDVVAFLKTLSDRYGDD